MFEKVIATLLHKYLGKYIQDLDTENLNVGIFGGDVQLYDLKIKPDAFYELDLPIEVKVGTIGKVTLKIPWGGFTNQAVVAEVEEVYIITAPITDREYDPEKEKRLMRASKRRKLELLEAENFLGTDAPESRSFIENLITTIMNNLQIFIRNVHIRYEDSVTKNGTPLACGICVQGISIETTNSKWKPISSTHGLSSIYQMIRVESFSVYCNPICKNLVGKAPGLDSEAPYTWRTDMKKGLEKFSIEGEEFDFILKPITAKMKVIVNKSNEARVPKLLVDFLLQDAATQLSRQQYLMIVELIDSFKRININRKFRQFHPGCPVISNTKVWWLYAFNSVLAQRVHPFNWDNIKIHRNNYRHYKDIYKQTLLNPTDTELKLDLQRCEDLLTITDIVIAREHAKLDLLQDNPEKVLLINKSGIWWKKGVDSKNRTELQVNTNKGRGIWSQLSINERSTLCDFIGYNEDLNTPEKPKQYTEHKINFTLANCTLSLVNRGHEVLVLTLSQFLASLETRPSAKAFKLSARVESFVIEGASSEHDLVPIITADNVYTGNNSSNFLAVDFEINPLNSEADYGVTIVLQPVEVVYHEHALSELVSFLHTPTLSLSEMLTIYVDRFKSSFTSIACRAIQKNSNIQMNLDLKLPYLVIPELGTIQKGGNLTILDFGQVKVRSELQPSNFNLDELTQMEIEERLYDRFHIDFTEMQILFCDSGELWRDAKKLHDSEFHLLPKLQCQVVFSNSLKPEYRLLPRYKLNVAITSVKFNVSDRKIGCVMDFLDNLPLPSANTVHVSISSNLVAADSIPELRNDFIVGDYPREKLISIKMILVEAGLIKKKPKGGIDREAAKKALLQVDSNFISSEHSDDDSELWARTVDLPGFDDNVSPNNIIKMLLRFIVGEIVVQLCRSSNRIDKPYLMLRITKICCDTAVMEYGPAVQASVGGIYLIDKLHTGTTGQYLELISCNSGIDVVTLLYRKVRSNCPDFKSHFHNVEQSLVLDFSTANVVLHREAFVTLQKYLQYLLHKIQSRELVMAQKFFKSIHRGLIEIYECFSSKGDPPIPPGAVKFSYSSRLSELKLKLCDTDIECIEIRIAGFESDCLFKANERMVLRFYLTTLSVDDLTEVTLYPKIISVDDEKVVEFKYVRHSPRFYKHTDIETKKDDVKSDGNFKLHVGRIQLVVLYKIMQDVQHFLEPFIKPGTITRFINKMDKFVSETISELRTMKTRLHLALDIRAPTLLLPQKITSPNLLILNLGDFSVENFFKETGHPIEGSQGPIIDNILIRLEHLQLNRAVMTLAGSLEVQEPIIQPLFLKFDIKRAVGYHSTLRSIPSGNYSHPAAQLLLYQVVGIADVIQINVGQRDLTTLLSVWSDNVRQCSIMLGDLLNNWHTVASLDDPHSVQSSDEHTVRKLQAFFYQSEPVRKEATMRLSFDGLQIYLFNDCDEILSSPVRDMNRSLCKLEAGEASLSLDMYSDFAVEMKIALQTCTLDDIRKANTSTIHKVLQSHCGAHHMDDNSHISVSTPPIIDVTFKQTQTGDRCVDILIERIRLNFSVSFVLDFMRFILDSVPADVNCDGGLINHGYVGETISQVCFKPKVQLENIRPPSSTDSTSGYFSSRASCFEEQTGLSISLHLRKPEILFYSNNGNNTVLTRAEILVDYSRHPGRESFVFSLSNLHILTKQSGLQKDKPIMVLHPCDIDVAKTIKNIEDGTKITLNISFIDVHVTASTVGCITSLIDEFNINIPDDDFGNNAGLIIEMEDLWSPKKISPYASVAADTTSSNLYNHDGRYHELLTIVIPKIRIMFELEEYSKRSPLILLKASADGCVQNWSSLMQIKGECQIQASYYNTKLGAWEPLLEPIAEEEGVYRPYEILYKVFQAKAYPVSSRIGTENNMEKEDSVMKNKINNNNKNLKRRLDSQESETSADEQDNDGGSMMFIRRQHSRKDSVRHKSLHESASMISYPEESDSDNEEGVMEKLATAISHLFTGDSSDGEGSDSDESSGAEPSADTEDGSEAESNAAPNPARETRAIFMKKRSDSVDSGLETEAVDSISTYVMFQSRDRLEFLITPQTLHVFNILHSSFTKKIHFQPESSLTLTNDILPNSTVKLLSKADVGAAKLIATSTFEHNESLPSTPSSEHDDFFSPAESEGDIDCLDGTFFLPHSKYDPNPELISPYLKFPVEPVTCLFKKVTDHRVRLQIPGFEEMDILCPQRTCNKLHLLQPFKNNTRYYIVLNVKCHEWGQSIVLRSPLQIKNETSYAVAIYYKRSVLESLNFEKIGESTNPFEDTNRIAIVEPDMIYNVPLTIAHHCRLYILPAYVETYSISDNGIWWQDLASDLNNPKDIICCAKDSNDQSVFSVRALCEENVPISRPSRLIPKYLIRLLPPLTIHNRLPYAIEIKIPIINFELRIEAGEKSSIYYLNLIKTHKIIVSVPSYLGSLWSGSFNLSPDMEEKVISMSTEQDTEGGNKQLGLSVKVDRGEACEVLLYAPYWIINKTGLPLQLRASLTDVVYEAQSEEPLLFCYRKQRKQCVRLRAYHSSWSSAFSLDTFGTSGLVVCKDRERKRRYRILLTISISEVCPQLTRIVTLLPNFLISNECKRSLRFMEENEKADLWLDIQQGQCIPFWPETDKMYMYVKFRDSKVVSQHFPMTVIHQTVLRMDKGGGITVNVRGGGDRPFNIDFSSYSPGDAPVRIDNFCEDLFLKIQQQHLSQVALLSPYQSMLYTWDDPCKERSLLWNVYNKKGKGYISDIWKDGYGQERVSFHIVKKQSNHQTAAPTVTAKLSASLKRLSTPIQDTLPLSSSSDESESDEIQKTPINQLAKKTRKDKVTVYWVSYLEGQQRVLLFTQDERVFYQVRGKIDAEKSLYELFISLKGIGISLASEEIGQLKEIMYLSLIDSAPIWEVSVAHKWKPLTLELTTWIEDRWRQDLKRAQMKEYVHVDFEKMHMTKPFFGELRRIYYPALWLQGRKSLHYSFIQCKLHKFQVENQINEAIYPIVLHPSIIPPAIIRKTGIRPCIEFTALKRHQDTHNQDVYKFIKILVQEFSLQLEKTFILSLYNVVSPWIPEVKPGVRIRSDIALLHQPLINWCSQKNDPKLVIEYIHLSPLCFKFNYSSSGRESHYNLLTQGKSFTHDFIHFIIELMGPSRAETKALTLKTAYLELRGITISPSYLFAEISSHYFSQLVQQFHVLVRGLDVLGNPYSLVSDFTDGLGELYYDLPFRHVECPEEFADGLAQGAAMLMGQYSIGSNGNASLITAALPSSAAYLNFDEDYKKRRRLCLQSMSDCPMALITISKTFEVGVALGLSGIVIKHLSGIQQQEGVETFFKGIGKGLMGLLTKPTGGIVDCIAMASDGVRRCAEMGEDFILRTRLPRYMNQYLGVKPFSAYEATGKQLLNVMCKGHYADSDIYWAHAPIQSEGKTFILITLQHVFLVEKCRIWGSWEIEWFVRVDDIMSVPTIVEDKLVFKIRQDESLNYLNGDERYVETKDADVLKWLQKKIEAAMILTMEDKPCPSVDA